MRKQKEDIVMNDSRQNQNVAMEGMNPNENQALLAELHKAGAYTREQVEAKSKEKAYRKRKQKKSGKPVQSQDLQERKSTANELQNKISGGGTFMANINNGKERNNVVGGSFSRGNQVLETKTLTGSVKTPNLIQCKKEVYLGEGDVAALTVKYALLKGKVPTYNLDQIPSLEEYLQMHNTVGAVVSNYKVHKNWKVAIKTEDESGEAKVIFKNYKEKKDKFPMLDTFGHALNQIGRWDNLDLGLSVIPEWTDPQSIGMVEPSRIEELALKIVNLHSFAGLNADYGIACELGCNPDIMTSSEREIEIDGETFVEYKQFFRHINMAEFVFASAFSRGPIKKLDGKDLSKDRYTELYTCVYDKETLKDRDKAFLLSCLKHD